ncbi:MAG: hypothetical protein J6K58_13850 [Lachnospiraceae bacterium]|nr:hypothetical protein [Lachnospiraceae bacterium]
MEYTLEELLPIVAKLTERYTSGESTSVTYERANRLMGAVLYCIGENEKENALVSNAKVPAKEAYRLGYEKVIEKVKRTQERYNTMILSFCAYGNENYHDTVTKALPAFFRYYDVLFAPQDMVITMDYPVLCPIGKSGIDAVEKYVAYIDLEQKFMGAFPKEYVYGIFRRFQRDYEKQFYNLCSIFYRHVLGCMLIGKKPGVENDRAEYMKLEKAVSRYSKGQLEIALDTMICCMVREKWRMVPELEDYLRADVSNFAADLVLAVENDHLARIVVL